MIDILPLPQKILIRRMRWMRIATTCLVGVILLVVIAAVLLLPTFETIQSRKVALGAYTKQLEAKGAIVSAGDISALEARTAVVAERLAGKIPESPLSYINTIKANQIQGIRLTGYEVATPEKRMVQLRGVAATRQVLQQFIAALQQDSHISAVDSPITNFVKSAESEFTMMITFTQS